jgi:hypothetical protein
MALIFPSIKHLLLDTYVGIELSTKIHRERDREDRSDWGNWIAWEQHLQNINEIGITPSVEITKNSIKQRTYSSVVFEESAFLSSRQLLVLIEPYWVIKEFFVES